MKHSRNNQVLLLAVRIWMLCSLVLSQFGMALQPVFAEGNSVPVITEGPSISVSMNTNNSPTAFGLTLHATDADAGDTLTWSISSPASQGMANTSGTGDSKVIGYDPYTDYMGSDSFTVQVSDGTGAMDTIIVNVTIRPLYINVHNGRTGWVEGRGWFAPASVYTLTIDDPGTTEPVDYSQTSDIPDFDVPDFHLEPGFIVTVTDGATTRSVVMIDQSITSINFVNSQVKGTTQSSLPLFVSANCHGATYRRNITPTPNIEWTVDFSTPGGTPQEQATVTIDYSCHVESGQTYPDRNISSDFWPYYNGSQSDPMNDGVNAEFWPPNTYLELRINGNHIDNQVMGQPGENGITMLDFDLGDYDLDVGDQVSIHAGPDPAHLDVYQLVYTVDNVDITSVNLYTEIVYGKADPNDDVTIWGREESQSVWGTRSATADENGDWSVDFSEPMAGGSYEERLIVDLTPEADLAIDSGDYHTEVFWPTNKSRLVDESGRTVFTENAELQVPSGAIGASTEFNLTETGSGFQVDTTNQGILDTVASAVVGPEGTSFAEGKPATVTLEWPDANNDGIVDETTINEADLFISKDGTVIAGPCGSAPNLHPGCDPNANTFSAQVQSLSYYVIGSQATNHEPSVSTATFEVLDDALNGASVGTVSYTDSDAGQNHTCAIFDGNVEDAFTINETTCEITVNDASKIDYAVTLSYGLEIRVQDDGAPVRHGTAAITVNVVLPATNTPPVITEGASIFITMSQNGSPTAFDLTLNATDADSGDTLTWNISSPASHGTASASGTGDFKAIGYTPNIDYVGSDSFAVQVDDGHGGTDTITVNLLVNNTTEFWNTFLGANGSDHASHTVVDGSGNFYITGVSAATWGNPLRTYANGKDAFVAKLDASGNLIWNTFLGGNGDDWGTAIVLDSDGNLHIAGFSAVTWGNPVETFDNGSEAFIAELDLSGNLIWNTFLGGSGDDIGHAITLDASGNIYVAGESNAAWGIPARAYSGMDDAFAAKLNSSGELQWNTFLGSSYDYDWGEYGAAIVVDGSGNLYVAGSSTASWGTPVQAYPGSYYNAFVSKLNSSDGALQWNTFLGGGHGDAWIADIALDGSNDVLYVVGTSNVTGYPIENFEAFVSKLNSNGALQWNTFIGSSVYDNGQAIALDGSGNVYVAGQSDATWGAPEHAYSSDNDAFAAKLDSSGISQWNTFIGGNGSDIGGSIALDGKGNLYVAGSSAATWGTPVRAYSSGSDAFVVKLPPPTSASNTTPEITEGALTSVVMNVNSLPIPFILTLNATDADPGDTLTWSISLAASHGTANVSSTPTGNTQAISYIPLTDYAGPDSFEVQVEDGNGGIDTITVNVNVQNTYTISGHAGIGAATLTYTGGSTIADGSGDYSFVVDNGWTGTITPTKADYYFTPASITISAPVTTKLTGQNFTATSRAFVKYSPVNGTAGVSTSPLLTWQTSQGADSYEYCLDTSNDTVCDTGWVSRGANKSVVLSGLNENTSYYWQVHAISADGTVEANGGVWWSFTTTGCYTLTKSGNPSGNVTASPAPNCTGEKYISGTVVQLTPVPASGYVFVNWSGDLSGSANPASVTMDADKSVTANFNTPPGSFPKYAPANGATNVTINPSLSWQTSTGAASYEYCIDTSNDTVCDTGWVSRGSLRSVGLSGLLGGTTYYWQARAVNGDGTVEANSGTWWSFTTLACYTLTTNGSPSGSVYASPATNCPGGKYTAGTVVQLSPRPAFGYTFSAWSGDLTGSANPGSVTMNADMSVTANYIAPPTPFSKYNQVNGATGVSINPLLNWGTSINATSYEYCIDTSNDTVCDTGWVSRGSLKSVVLSGLTANTTYYWQARAVNGIATVNANGGTWWSFTTTAP